MPSGLMCPISYDRMQDPVILIPSGDTYDCEQICKSLSHHPNLDPSSGVRYDRKLQYCDNLAVRRLLMETYGDKAFQKYDDSGFQTCYERAWNSGNVGAGATLEQEQRWSSSSSSSDRISRTRRTSQTRTRRVVLRHVVHHRLLRRLRFSRLHHFQPYHLLSDSEVFRHVVPHRLIRLHRFIRLHHFQPYHLLSDSEVFRHVVHHRLLRRPRFTRPHHLQT
jgi:hypothetical protein